MKKLLFFIFLIILKDGITQINRDSLNSVIDTCQNIDSKFQVLQKVSRVLVLSNQDYEYIKAKADKIFSSLSTEVNQAKENYYLGSIYLNQKKLNESIEYFFKCLEIAEKIKNHQLVALSHNRLGDAYKEIKNNDYAKKHYRFALNEYDIAGQKTDVSEMCNLLGTIYKNEGVLDSALHFHNIALEIRLKLGDKNLLASTYNNLGLVYKKQKSYDLALTHLKLALGLRKEINDKKGTAGASINIGNVLVKQGKYQEALEYVKEGTQLAYEIKAGDFYKNGLEANADCYYFLKDYKKSVDFYNRFRFVNDSLASDKVTKEILELTAQYESSKKDAELSLQNEKLKTQQSEINKQKLFIGSSIIVILLVITLVFFAYRSNRINKRNALNLERKNIIIEQKNKEITDSINYARRIQTSILTTETILQQHLPEHFILFKPKDIVSGDFYWFYPIPSEKNSLLIAAADCTGHGVPGAFMSLIGKEKLDKAASITANPGKILEYININVKSALQQDSEQLARDGMDIALAKIQFNENSAKVCYAGANRPLWVIRKGSEEIEQINSTKCAIAGHTDDNQIFEEHDLILQKGDTIYLFSDGYADQFGGENSKKLTTKSFKKLLLSQKAKSMHDQKSYFNNFIEMWMKGQEQVDDILLIGIRI